MRINGPGSASKSTGPSAVTETRGAYASTAGPESLSSRSATPTAPQLQIRPKLDLDLFFLADYAYGRERNRVAQHRLEAHVDACGKHRQLT